MLYVVTSKWDNLCHQFSNYKTHILCYLCTNKLAVNTRGDT